MIKAIFSVCLLLFSTQTIATATINYSQGVLAFSSAGAYTLTYWQPAGSIIDHASVNITANNFTGNCSLIQTLQVNGNEISLGSGIYATSLSGVGMSFYLVTATGERIKLKGTLPVSYPTNNLSGPGAISGVAAEIVLTGTVLTGLLSNLPSVTVNVSSSGAFDACSDLTSTSQTLQTTVSSSAVNATSCLVLTPSIQVILPNISNSTLRTIGATAGDTRFNIELNCLSGVTVFVTLTDASDVGNTGPLLSLKPSSTAMGIKLRIVKGNGQVVQYGPDSDVPGNLNQWLIGASATTNNIPLMVQYYREGASVSSGSVEAAATFTLSYQ
jgi:type 1 fimbria pilin